jgi:hypothetical protein
MSSITGKKILQGNFISQENDVNFPNISGIKINKTTKENIFEIFNLLTIKWTYIPTETQQKDIISYFEKYYNSYYINYLKRVFNYHKNCLLLENTVEKPTETPNKHWFKHCVKKMLGQKNVEKIKKMLKK